MSLSRVIEVSFNGGSIAYVKADTAYFYNNGIIFKPTDIDLPTTYQVHWSDSPQASSTLETIGTAEGAPIPDDLWDRSRVIYGWIYLHPTVDSGVTGYEVRIYKSVRAGLPDGTEPTPAEQSTIDQLIGALNGAVEQTGEDAESASQSAQSAESAKTAAESARDTAQGYANSASASATASAQSASASAQIKSDIEGMVEDAQGYADSASQSATASANSATTAQGYANSASASAQSASGYASSAQTSANTASTKASEASASASTASTKASEAAQSATNAQTYANTAESAKTASQTAQGLAESAKNDAEQIKTDVQNIADGIDTRLVDVEDALADKAPVITDTASGAIASFSDGADDLPLKSLVVDIDPIQDLSHGDPSPENFCPISGWTGANVNASGKNLFEIDDIGTVTVISNGILATRNGYIFKKAGTYTISASVTNNSSYLYARLLNADGSYSSSIHYIVVPGRSSVATIIVPIGAKLILYDAIADTISASKQKFAYCNIQVELGSTATPYEPYTGRSITIDLGQTVYGGKLDVLSGVLTVDRAKHIFGQSDAVTGLASGTNGRRMRIDIDDARIPTTAQRFDFMCNAGTPSPNALTSTAWKVGDCLLYDYGGFAAFFYIVPLDCNTAQKALDYIMGLGLEIVYPLAEPIEIQLTPTQINSLYGVNNLWADSGDTEAVYRADTKLFIERLTAPDSVDMIADANIQSGKYFMVGNSLYKATANIANGAQIIVGTNCIRKSLSEALNEINA